MNNNYTFRKIDHLGRISIPTKFRHYVGIDDCVEISVDGEKIILEKHKDFCVFCGANIGIELFKGKRICQMCKNELQNYIL